MFYTQGAQNNWFYCEAKRVVVHVKDYDVFISIQLFYKDKFALVIDLLSIAKTSCETAL